MTAQTILLSPVTTAKRLPTGCDICKTICSLAMDSEGVSIERLAGDLWKADRAEGSAGARISFRLRHGPVDQALKEMGEAIELGQHLLWQPAFPLPVGLNEGDVKGALGKFGQSVIRREFLVGMQAAMTSDAQTRPTNQCQFVRISGRATYGRNRREPSPFILGSSDLPPVMSDSVGAPVAGACYCRVVPRGLC